MDREEIETLITTKIEADEADIGLYDAGLQYVVVDIINTGKGNRITFTWFDNLRTVDDLVTA